MLKRLILSIFLIFLLIFSLNLACFCYEAHLPKGTLVKVITKIPYTSANLEVGSPVYFIAPHDVWVLEKKIIESGDIFQGHISMLKMPVQGVNAAISIDIDNIVKKSTGETLDLKGKIIFSNSDKLGGDLTNPLSYNTSIHPRKVYGNPWGGTLQYVPSGEYEFGSHVTINYRDLLFVELSEDFYQ